MECAESLFFDLLFFLGVVVVVVAVFSRYLPCSRGREFEMAWQKKKGPWSWDQNACGKWVLGLFRGSL